MALKTKAKIAKIGEALGNRAGEFTFQTPPLIDAPNTLITKADGSPRQLPDPSKTLKPVMGVERIKTVDIKLLEDEIGPNGERVYSVANDPRIRLWGEWRVLIDTQGARINSGSGIDEEGEITFFGTGLNFLSFPNSGTSSELEVSIDGGSFFSINPLTENSAMTGRNYSTNTVHGDVNLRGLTLDNHTVRFRFTNNLGALFGIEILNETASIQIPQGEAFAAGNKYVNDALVTTTFNSDFEGSPVLNGKGGRVSIYITPEGQLKKAIRQTASTQLNLGAADHSEEEIINSYVPRQFGANRPDDFSTLAQDTTSTRFFTLEDGTTSLEGQDIRFSSTTGLDDGLFMIGSGDFINFTFIGTGLDVEISNVSAVDAHDIFVNNVNVGSYIPSSSNTRHRVKIVSGLPYGTHSVRFARPVSTGATFVYNKFIVYGPKKPEIPSDSLELRDYFLTADFVANTTSSVWANSTGVIKKQVFREMAIRGSGWGLASSPTQSSAGHIFSNSIGAVMQYEFTGTGFDLRQFNVAGRTQDVSVRINGQALTAANFPTATFTTHGCSFNDTTGSLNCNFANVGAGFITEGLPYGTYTVEFENNQALFFEPDSFDIITPIHYPSLPSGSDSMGPGVQLQEEIDSPDDVLGKAKAWIQYDTLSNEILSSHNVASVLELSTSKIIVYLEIPFRDDPIIVASGSGSETIEPLGIDGNSNGLTEKLTGFALESGTASNRFYAVAYGRLVTEDEE